MRGEEEGVKRGRGSRKADEILSSPAPAGGAPPSAGGAHVSAGGAGLLGSGLDGIGLDTSGVTANTISDGGGGTIGTFGGGDWQTAVTPSITTGDGKARVAGGGGTPNVSVPECATETAASTNGIIVDSVQLTVITLLIGLHGAISADVDGGCRHRVGWRGDN